MKGVTIVVSPLIALMHDQVVALKANGIKAAMISSANKAFDNEEILYQAKIGQLDLLYVSPERLTTKSFLDELKTIKINFFVVDEAHCVSEWGHEFREDYRRLGIIKQNFPNAHIAAFTATATQIVEKDIVKSLLLQNNKLFRGKTYRENLMIRTQKRVDNGYAQLLDFIQHYPNQSGIVYTLSRREAEQAAEHLKLKGYNAAPYHAGLSARIRERIYHGFATDNTQIIVATIAFGMGVDKSNIRFVVHMTMPKTIENYYQEIGRAGRDGLHSETMLLYSKSDELRRQGFMYNIEDEEYKKLLVEKLREMYNLASGSECRHKEIAHYFGDEIEDCNNHCDNCTKGQVEQADISVSAQKALLAIQETSESSGRTHIISVLRGSKNQVVRELGHNEISSYASGLDKTKQEWSAIIERLLEVDAIDIVDNRILTLSDFGKEVLAGKASISIDQDKIGRVMAIKPTTQQIIGNAYFDMFKKKRKEIADKLDIPAYTIFSDKALLEIAQKLPITRNEMLSISGVGETKFERYGKQFIELAVACKLTETAFAFK
jgi:ATP-dependent DNA helicase RecQ